MSKHYFTTCAGYLYPLFAYCLKEREQAYEITIFVMVYTTHFNF